MQSKLIESLQERSILDLDAEFRRIFLERGEVIQLSPGQSVCEQGQKVHRLIIPIDYSLALVTHPSESDQNNQNGRQHVGYLSKSRSLCLKELLLGDPAPYSAIAERDTAVIAVPGAVITNYLNSRPQLRFYLLAMTQSSGFRSLKRFLTSKHIDNKEVFKLFPSTLDGTSWLDTSETHSDGQLIASKGSGIWLIESGSIRVGHSEDESLIAMTLSEGAFIGGQSLVPPFRSSYKLVSGSDGAQLRFISLSVLEKLPSYKLIVESLFDEPYLRNVHTGKGDNSEEGSHLNLPGTRLSASDFVRVCRFIINPEKLIHVSLAKSAAWATTANFLTISGVEPPLVAIRNELEHLETATPIKLAVIFERYGFSSSQIATKYNRLNEQICPAIVKLGDRPVILVKAAKSHVYIIDACQGFLKMPKEEFSKLWNGIILEVSRSPIDLLSSDSKNLAGTTENTEISNRVVVGALVKCLLELKLLLVNRLVLTLASMGIGLLGPMFIQHLIDQVLIVRDQSTVIVLLLGSFITGVVASSLGLIGNLNWTEFNIRLEHRTNSLLYQHIMNSKIATAIQDRVGDTLARFQQLATVQSFVAESGFKVGQNLLSLIMYSAILIFYDFRLALIALTLLPITAGIQGAFRSRLRKRFEDSFAIEKALQSQTTEQITSMTAIKSSGAEKQMMGRWENAALAATKNRRSVQLETSGISAILQLSNIAVQALCMYVSYSLVLKGELTLGALFAVNMYVQNLIGPVQSLAGLFDEVSQFKIALNKTTEVFKSPKIETVAKSLSSSSIELNGKIKLERVSYRYGTDLPWVLSDIDITIFPNQIVALVGRSGCGKTTLARILSDDVVPTSGRIFYNDFDASQISRHSLRSQIASILQDNQLFAGTIDENIAFGDDFRDEAKLKRAIEQSGTSLFLGMVPGGSSYHLTEGGLGLSGGQKQRISIARSLYRDCKIVVMDEATSALDAESESLIISQLRSIMQGKTAIIVAHRLSTIRRADRIIVLKDGRIVEDGTYEHLMQYDGHFVELFRDQTMAAES